MAKIFTRRRSKIAEGWPRYRSALKDGIYEMSVLIPSKASVFRSNMSESSSSVTFETFLGQENTFNCQRCTRILSLLVHRNLSQNLSFRRFASTNDGSQ